MSSASLLFLFLLAQAGQTTAGDLRLRVTDRTGLPVASSVELVSAGNELHELLRTTPDGRLVARALPFGMYSIAVRREGFTTFTGTVEIRSAVPTDVHVTLDPAFVHDRVTVTAGDTLLDPHQPASVHRIGRDTLRRSVTALPGRAVSDAVNTQPGWLLEANGVLHPRGSEYQTQFVIDGLPLTDNRSPAFAPEIDGDTMQALSILTGGYPAEYGRKLGGIVEVVTRTQPRAGLHGLLDARGGSFSTGSGSTIVEQNWDRARVGGSLGVSGTDRYLDPPVEENFTNRGTVTAGTIQAEVLPGTSDRLSFGAYTGRARFLVPNERLQQEAGQRQDRTSEEHGARFSYQHLFETAAVFDVRGMVRGVSARLWSNAESTPIAAWQHRSLREGYVKGALTMHRGLHELKFGGDLVIGRIDERLNYEITDPGAFDPETPVTFAFAGRADDREGAVFAQDQLRLGAWTVNAGLRWDRYRLLVQDSVVSPRAAVAWSWPSAGLVLKASYDRTFETPAYENLLVASSPDVEALSETVVRLPVPPSYGHFFEGHASKSLAGAARLDASVFARRFRNFADDDLLLNTGVSFPMTFDRAAVHGVEVELTMPERHGVSGAFSYGWMKGTGRLPITGGLLLGDDADEELESRAEFPISQDQRHTVRAQAAWRIDPRVDVGLQAAYGSGLPFELDGDLDEALDQYGPRIVRRLDVAAGRVGPSFTVDLTSGVTLRHEGRRSMRLQVDVRNLTNRLNVINFAGLFSGTALGAPRSVSARVRYDF